MKTRRHLDNAGRELPRVERNHSQWKILDLERTEVGVIITYCSATKLDPKARYEMLLTFEEIDDIAIETVPDDRVLAEGLEECRQPGGIDPATYGR